MEQNSKSPRIVKIAAIQTSFDCENLNFLNYREHFFTKIEKMINQAASEGANIVGLPELFCKCLKFRKKAIFSQHIHEFLEFFIFKHVFSKFNGFLRQFI